MNACCRWWNLEYRYRKLHDYVRYYPIALVAEKYFATFRNSAGLQTEDIAEIESNCEWFLRIKDNTFIILSTQKKR